MEASCGTVAKSNRLGTDPGGESIHRLVKGTKATILVVESGVKSMRRRNQQKAQANQEN